MDITLPIRNFPAQQEIFDHPARNKIVVKGRRFGLTRGASNDFIKCALDGKFKQGLWVDTVNSNIDRYVARYFLPALKKLPQEIEVDGKKEVIWNWSKQAKTLYILDSFIDFRSVDRPENLEGFGYDKAFLNEAGIILKDEYLYYNAIAPMLFEFKPTTVIGGTPKGSGGLFHRLALMGQSAEHPDYKYFHFTTFDNPYLTRDEIEQNKTRVPQNVWLQEWLGEFLEDAGVVFRGISRVMTAQPKEPITGHVYVMGVDLAKVQDYTVIAIYDRENRAQVYQDRFNHLNWGYQKQKIIALSKHYNDALVVVDASGLGDPIAEDLAMAGVPVDPFKFTNSSKKELVEKLMLWIEQRKMTMINIPETEQEFRAFTYDVSSSGLVRYNAPIGMHDDIIMAHGLAIRNLVDYQPTPVPKISRIKAELIKRMGGMEDDGEEYIAI